MKERPILMHARSINGILGGRKTQTRRIIKPQPQPNGGTNRQPIVPYFTSLGKWTWVLEATGHGDGTSGSFCPYGQAGDRLWVRETWGGDDLCGFAYRADHPDWPRFHVDGEQPDSRWKPSIHMPRKASRLTLEITGIRVERVQDISIDDARAEGIPEYIHEYMKDSTIEEADIWRNRSSAENFRQLWDDTNGKGAWERNDWCWVVDFKKVTE